jgi:DNA-binding transcriptional LysR family regulator
MDDVRKSCLRDTQKRMDRLDCMQALVASVDHGSLSRAAHALGRSITAISRAVSALEERLGTTLLIRTTRALKLTEAGERYVAVCRSVLSELADAEERAGSAVAAPHGVLTVTAPVMFGALHVRPIVDAYLSAHPDVRVRLLLIDRVVNVLDEGIDAAVRIAHLPDSALVATSVGATHRVVCASPAYLARHGKPTEPRALADHRCISFTALTPSETWTFGAGPEGGRAKQVKVDPVLTVNTAEAAIASALDGQGVTCALSYQVAAPLRAGTLTALLTAYEPDSLPVHLVSAARAATSAKVRAFIDLAAPALRDALAPVTRAPKRPSNERRQHRVES